MRGKSIVCRKIFLPPQERYVVILNAKRIEDENLLTFRIFQFDVVFSLVQKNLHLRQAMFPRRGGQEATSVPPFAGKIVLEVCGNE